MQVREATIAHNSGARVDVDAGQVLVVRSRSIVDVVPINRTNPRERFDQARTRTNQQKIFISVGDTLYSKFNNVLMTILRDTYPGFHDLQYGMCSTSSYDDWIRRSDGAFKKDFDANGIRTREDLPPHGCWENLQDAFDGLGIGKEDIPSPLNLFQSMRVLEDGTIVRRVEEDRPNGVAEVHLRAETDLIVGMSACPEMASTGGSVNFMVLDTTGAGA